MVSLFFDERITLRVFFFFLKNEDGNRMVLVGALYVVTKQSYPVLIRILLPLHP
jgi:hypothetical protein